MRNAVPKKIADLSIEDLDLDKPPERMRELPPEHILKMVEVGMEKSAPSQVTYDDIKKADISIQIAQIGFALVLLFFPLYATWRLLFAFSSRISPLLSVGIFIFLSTLFVTILKSILREIVQDVYQLLKRALELDPIPNNPFENPREDFLTSVALVVMGIWILLFSFMTPGVLGAQSINELLQFPPEFVNRLISTILLEFIRGSGYLLSIGLLSAAVNIIWPYLRESQMF
ncbi:hypothetical protein GJ631_14940 [Natronomonas sp. CBA1123]|uniref:hypothetical protein n=1 Tax=Natronomonas sp. CBA1123 TaxID=2668070 RepID=UPI0012E9AD12|nr:hypothetical protein [Natronomonas sp. CBA1123]MUV87811.1 hypothetical protein [Natronomonas sp. CBA1123]